MARTSAGTGSTSNYGLNSSYGPPNTAGHKMTIFAIININDVTQSAGHLFMARVSGGGSFFSISLSNNTSKAIAITSTISSGEYSGTTIDFTGLSGVWRYVCWNKLVNGLGQFDKWFGIPGSSTGSDKSSISGSSNFLEDTFTPNRTTMFAGWSGGDAISSPVGCKIQALGVWMDNSVSDSDIIDLANGVKTPDQITPAATVAYNMPGSESGNIVDYASGAHNLTVSGTIGSDPGPFPTSMPPELLTYSFGSQIRPILAM